MARKNTADIITMVEAELISRDRILEIVRCYSFHQSATRHIRKLDGTTAIEIGEISFRLEAGKDWDTKENFKIKLAGENTPWVVKLEHEGSDAHTDKSIYSARTVGADTTLEKLAQNLLVVSS